MNLYPLKETLPLQEEYLFKQNVPNFEIVNF